MHDLRLVREQLHLLRDGFARREKLDVLGPILDRLERLEKERRALITAVEERKARRNLLTQDVAQRKRAGEDATALVTESRGIGAEIARLEADLTATESTVEGLMLELPNVTHDSVPAGDETHNRIIRSWGAPRIDESVRPHWDVAGDMGILDLARGANALMISETGKEPRVVETGDGDGYSKEIDYIIDCVAKRQAPTVVSALDGVTALEICEAEEQSIRSGVPVKL